MSIITVPKGLRFNETAQWRLQTLTASAGPALDGRQQYITRENRTWQARYQVRGAWDQLQGAYIGFLDQLQGAANTFTIPVSNFSAVIAPEGDHLFVMDDDAENIGLNDSLTLIALLDDDPNVKVGSQAPAGATQIITTGLKGKVMLPGAFFSNDDFLYRVNSNADGVLSFAPPLRQAIGNGQTLEVRNPTCRVRLATDEIADAAHDFDRRRGPYTIAVAEAFER